MMEFMVLLSPWITEMVNIVNAIIKYFQSYNASLKKSRNYL